MLQCRRPSQISRVLLGIICLAPVNQASAERRDRSFYEPLLPRQVDPGEVLPCYRTVR